MARKANMFSSTDFFAIEALYNASARLETTWPDGRPPEVAWSDYDVYLTEDARGVRVAIAIQNDSPIYPVIGSVTVKLTDCLEYFLVRRTNLTTTQANDALLECMRLWFATVPSSSRRNYIALPVGWPRSAFFETTIAMSKLPIREFMAHNGDWNVYHIDYATGRTR